MKRILLLAYLLVSAALTTSGAQLVTRIAAGNHSLFLKDDGSLWGMGYDIAGNTNRPDQIVAGGVTAITGGSTLFVKGDGSLWAMGWNEYGQLGDGTYNYISQPQQIVATGVVVVAAGGYHSLFLKSDGSLWGMGYNGLGGLGDGIDDSTGQYATNRPEQIVTSNVAAIAAGQYFSLFLKNDSSLWGMGLSSSGELGDGIYHTNAPYGTNFPEQIVASGVTAIAAGASHSLFLKSDGSLWAMGYNVEGQLGDGTYNHTNRPEQIVTSGVTAVAAGGGHTLFLKSDGSLWAMGWNQYGQLGDGTYNNTNRPEQIVASGVTAIAAGDVHSLFLKSDGSLWAMGDNEYGSLGDGTYATTNRPEQIMAGPPGYNQIAVQLSSGGSVRLSFVGIAGANYALDRSFSLVPPNWVPLATNPADAGGVLMFTNIPDPAMNNFWRIRSVP